MKRTLFVLFALVIMSSFAFTQHIDYVKQEGSNNTATTTQETKLPHYIGNEAYVTQLGNLNTSNIYHNNNGHYGSAAFAQVWQQGNTNWAMVWQNNDGHKAWITSIGHRNKALAEQNGNKTQATIYQDGNDNIGYIWEAGNNGTYGYIRQIGSVNRADQIIGGSGWGNQNYDSYFSSQQLGNNNTSYQEMESVGNHPGSVKNVDNHGDIWQQGNRNIAQQRMYYYEGDVVGNVATATQVGHDNRSYQWMKGENNSSTHNQVGNDNYAMTKQNW